MTYLVSARRWRPQTFEDLVGQEHVSRTLANAIRAGRVAHAFLFTGVRGVGKTTAARILAKALNCEQGPTPTPCNACVNCQEITAGQRGRRAGDRRRLQHRRRRRARDHRERALPGGQEPLQDLHHRRGAHALHQRLQRAAEDARGAAGARQVHLRHHRSAQAAGHRAVALPALRLPPHPAAPGRRAAAADRRRPRRSRSATARCSCWRAKARAACATRSRCSTRCWPAPAGAVRDEDVLDTLGLADRAVIAALADAIIARDPARVLRAARRGLPRTAATCAASRAICSSTSATSPSPR